MRRIDFRKANTYKGQRINVGSGHAIVSYKIDGVRILYRDGMFVTRNDKIPPGLSTALTDNAKAIIRIHGDCEVFVGSFKETSRLLAKHHPEPNSITQADIYPLVELDERLFLYSTDRVEPAMIEKELQKALKLGYEGLVIRTDTHWYRVKPESTADVYITGYFEQLDKNKKPKGILGGFNTNYGKVTAFTDSKRIEFWKNPEQYIGQLMEVQYKELYDTGNFRYAVKFLNLRTDKDCESFDV